MKNDAQSGDYYEGEKSAQRRACGVRASFMTKEGRAAFGSSAVAGFVVVVVSCFVAVAGGLQLSARSTRTK